MTAALTDALAKTVLGILHPTGSLKAQTTQMTCGPSSCTADWTLEWEGGLITRTDETTVLAWTVTSFFESTATVKSESSSFSADGDMLKKVNDILGDQVFAFGPRPDSGDAGLPGSPLQVVANSGVDPQRFWRMREKMLWAITPAGDTDCDRHAMNQPVGTSIDTSKMNQFDRRDAEQKAKDEIASLKAHAPELAASLNVTNVVFKFSGKLVPADLSAIGGPLEKDFSPDSVSADEPFPFVPYLSEYDFTKHAYTLLIVAKKDGRWPIGAKDPKIESKATTVSVGTSERTGVSVGGKEITVSGSSQMHGFDVTNRARLAVQLPMPEDRAKSIADGANVSLLIVERPQVAHFNKACVHRAGGEPDDLVDDGIGYVFSAETVGYEVRIGGDLVASQEPP